MKTAKVHTLISFVALLTIGLGLSPVHASVLDDVKDRGMLRCGVDAHRPGFAAADADGAWSGFDVDYCRAIAAAVLGDGKLVQFVPVTSKDRFRAVQSGEIDVLFRDTAWTMARDTALGLMFAGMTFLDGEGFMVPRALGIDSALQMTGAKVCVETGSEAEAAVDAYFKAHSMAYTPVAVANGEAERAAYSTGRCNALTGLVSALHATRLGLAKPEDHVVLPELLSKEPLGPVVLQGDDRWFAVVRWVHFALLDAEELGVTQDNVAAMAAKGDADVRLLLGAEGGLGKDAGLPNTWAAAAIAAVGNYGEVFERNLGMGSALKMPRGLNALWTNGGIQFAPPIH